MGSIQKSGSEHTCKETGILPHDCPIPILEGSPYGIGMGNYVASFLYPVLHEPYINLTQTNNRRILDKHWITSRSTAMKGMKEGVFAWIHKLHPGINTQKYRSGRLLNDRWYFMGREVWQLFIDRDEWWNQPGLISVFFVHSSTCFFIWCVKLQKEERGAECWMLNGKLVAFGIRESPAGSCVCWL